MIKNEDKNTKYPKTKILKKINKLQYLCIKNNNKNYKLLDN